jgi:putative heme iron utilization protein
MQSPLTADETAAICRLMNEDHADAIAAYGDLADVESAEMLALDCHAMELGVETAGGRILTRISFDHVLADKHDARDTLIAMARRAMEGA